MSRPTRGLVLSDVSDVAQELGQAPKAGRPDIRRAAYDATDDDDVQIKFASIRALAASEAPSADELRPAIEDALNLGRIFLSDDDLLGPEGEAFELLDDWIAQPDSAV